MYYKISNCMKQIKNILLVFVAIYILVLSTNSMFCLYEKTLCCDTVYKILNVMDFKSFVLDTYKASFIIMLLVVLFNGRKNKYSFKGLITMIAKSLLFLPVCALLMFNFVVLGNFMSSFYLLVVLAVICYIVDRFTLKIDKLYGVAVGGSESYKKGKGK